jgi:chemotaxis protein CheD
MTDNLLKVGIGDMKVATKEDGIITYALGSCVGICLYDPVTKIAGMVHIMLPEPNISRVDNIAKYATTGIPELIRQMTLKGASKFRMTAKIAGGAEMFEVHDRNSSVGKIGHRNVEMVKRILQREKIRIIGEDCGLNYARTLTFTRMDGMAYINTYGHGEKKF